MDRMVTGLRSKPRLCYVGPMLGRNQGWVPSQGEILAELFTQTDYEIRLTSGFPNRFLRLIDTIYSLISWRNAIDIVIIDVFSGLGFGVADIASWASKNLGKPVIFFLRGGSLPQFYKKRTRWVARVLNRGDAIVAPSKFLGACFENHFSITIIPNVIDLDKYPYQHRPCVTPRLLWMRTFHEIYNPSMAVEVFAQLCVQHPEAWLTMAGQDKGMLASTRVLAGQLKVDDQICFAGFLDLAGKQREFANHDIYIHTNHVDNVPVSVVEAGAFGLPVVATAVGGIPYMLEHEKNALLVQNGNISEMVESIERLIINADLAANLSKNGRKLAENFAWSQVRKPWEQLLEQVNFG